MQKKIPQAREFDLNLLGIFEEIYKFGSVTKAAQSLKQSPPSISQSLQKLRVYFSDPLFVRNGMQLSKFRAISVPASVGVIAAVSSGAGVAVMPATGSAA